MPFSVQCSKCIGHKEKTFAKHIIVSVTNTSKSHVDLVFAIVSYVSYVSCMYFIGKFVANPFLSSVATNPIIPWQRAFRCENKKVAAKKFAFKRFGWLSIFCLAIANTWYTVNCFHIMLVSPGSLHPWALGQPAVLRQLTNGNPGRMRCIRNSTQFTISAITCCVSIRRYCCVCVCMLVAVSEQPLVHTCQSVHLTATAAKNENNIEMACSTFAFFVCCILSFIRLTLMVERDPLSSRKWFWPFSYMDTWYLFNAPNIK